MRQQRSRAGQHDEIGDGRTLAGSGTLLPVLAHVVAAKRFDQSLERLRSWIERRQTEISAIALLAIGVVLVLTGLGGR